MKKKTILMIANSDTAMNGFLALQECFADMENICCKIVCHKRVHVDNVIKRCDIPKEKISAIYFCTQKSAGNKENGGEYRYKADIVPIALVKALFNVLKLFYENMFGIGKAYRIIKQTEPRIILLYADNKAEFEKYFIYWAKKKGIRTIVAPICFSSITGILSNPTNGFRLDVNSRLPISARILRRLLPKHERLEGKQRIFWGQPFATIIDFMMHLSAPNPWVQGSLADIVCTSYRKEYEEIRRELGDVAIKKLFLTDSIEDGIVLRSYQDRNNIKRFLNNKYKENTQTMVIAAFSERNEGMSKESDLYDKNIIVQSILKYYPNVFISLHPRSNVEENRFLEQYEGSHILEEPLRKVIAAADTIFYGDVSSIGRWVELLGIKKVTWRSYSMWEKWTPDIIEDFQKRLKKMKEEQDRKMDDKEEQKMFGYTMDWKNDVQTSHFADLVLNLL